MKKLLSAFLLSLCLMANAYAQNAITLPYAAAAVASIGPGPIKVRVTQGNASIFTAQGSGVGSTAGSSTSLTLTGTPVTPPVVGANIIGTGIAAGTTVTAYNGTTGVTLSAVANVAASTSIAWGAACPSSSAGVPTQFIQASVMADYYLLYTLANVCAISPGGPSNTLLILPVFYDSTTPPSSGGTSVTLTNTHIFVGNASNVAADVAMSGDATMANTGAIAVTKTGGVAFGSLATLTPGTGVAAALAINIGTAGSPVLNGGALGTPSSGVGTNITGIQRTNITGLGTGVAAALGVNIGSAGAPVLFNGAGGTPSSLTLTSATGLPIATGVSGLGTGVATQLANAVSTAGGSTQTIASGATAMGTGAISSATCATAVAASALNVVTTDVLAASFNGDPTGVVGYVPSTSGGLTIFPYPTSGNVNFKVCNFTASSITPSPLTLNWRVTR